MTRSSLCASLFSTVMGVAVLLLLLLPVAGAAQAEEGILEELLDARYNLAGFGISLARTINTPMTALAFLTRDRQARSQFTIERDEVVDGVPCRRVAFVEAAVPSLITSEDGTVEVRGRIWIERDSGHIRRTELTIVTRRADDSGLSAVGVITTVFSSDAIADHRVPVRMEEHYDIRRGALVGTIDGQASYSNFRQFGVTVREEIR